jgi:hypothetical protein
MERALGSWPGLLFGSQWVRVTYGLLMGLCLQQQVLAQEDWKSSRSQTYLVFQGNADAPVSQFQIPLKKTIADQETVTLTAADLGPITLRNTSGQTFDLTRYRWKIDPSSRLYSGQSGYKSLIAVYQYGDTSQYSLRLNCRTRKELVNCAMNGNGPLFDDEVVAKGSFNVGSGSTLAASSGTSSGSAPSTSSSSSSSTGTTTRLPRVNGINLQDVQIIPAEKQADPTLEQAILANYFGGAGGETRYFYNRIDLNGDNAPETIVYLVGKTACESGGCITLIFQSDRSSQYRLVTQMTQANQPIIVSDNRSNRWKDLVTYVAGGGGVSGYRLLRYDGRSYPSTPSAQPSLPNPTYLRGTAVIGDRIQPDTNAPILGQGSGTSPANGPGNGNYPPPPPETDNQPIASGGQSSAYRRGYELGQLDAKQSILRNAARHRTEYDPASESEFRRGYDNGYSNYASGNSTSGTASNGTGGSWNGSSSDNRPERDPDDWDTGPMGNPGSNPEDDAGVTNAPGDRPPQGNGNQYQGQGTLIVSPRSQGQAERYVLNRIQIESGSRARLVLYTSDQSETIEMQGQLESRTSGKSMILSSIDGAPAQGTVLIGSNGSLRTTNPIVVDSEDSEVSVDFRPN